MNEFVFLTISGRVAVVPISRGLRAIVDVFDLPLVNTFRWHAHRAKRTSYARGFRVGSSGQRIQIYMHRLLMNPGVAEVDHRNGDGLDNRRENLRVCTRAQNSSNQRKQLNRTSPFKGVVRKRRAWGRFAWISQIKDGGKHRYLGTFASELEAARAYNDCARNLFGEFSNLNLEASVTS